MSCVGLLIYAEGFTTIVRNIISFAEELKKLLKNKHKSQKELAESHAIGKPLLSLLQDLAIPTFEVNLGGSSEAIASIIQLAAVLGVPERLCDDER